MSNPIETINSRTILNSDNNYARTPLTIEEEDKFLRKVDKYIIEKQHNLHEKSKFENLTIKEFIDNLYKVLYDIIEDIAKLKFNNDDNINQKWWEKYIIFIEQIINILFLPERALYMGIIFMIIAFSLYFIDITK